MFERVRRVLTGSAAFYECRQCGTQAEHEGGCTACGSEEIARYEL